MARPAKFPPLTAHQAKYILEKAIDEKQLSAADIRRYLSGMWEEMSTLEKRISELRGIAANVHPVRATKRAARQVAETVAETTKAVTKRVRRKMKASSPEVLASRKLQGQYISALRGVAKTKRARYSAIAREQGREAAIREIKKSTGKQ